MRRSASARPVKRVNVTMGKGQPRVDAWAREGRDQRVGVDLSNPVEPVVDVHLRDVGSARLCAHEGGGLVGEASMGSAQNFRVHYQKQESEGVVSYLEVEAREVQAGTLRFSKTDAGVAYEGPGSIPFLEVKGMVPSDEKVLGRSIRSFVLTANNVPASFTIGLGGEIMILESSSNLGRLDLDVNLVAPPPATGAGGSDPGFELPTFKLDASGFSANRLKIKMTDGGPVRWPGREKHQFVFENRDSVKLGIDFTQFNGVVLDLNGPVIDVRGFQVSAESLRASLKLPVTAPIPDVTVVIPRMPKALDFFVHAEGLKAVRSFVQPIGSELEEVRIGLGPSEHSGFVITAAGIPASSRLDWSALVGAAFTYSLLVDSGLGSPIGSFSLAYHQDADHYVRLNVGETRSFFAQADVDGSTQHEGNPRLLWIRTPFVDDVTVDIVWGKNAVSFRGTGLAATAGVLLTLAAATDKGVERIARAGIIVPVEPLGRLPTLSFTKDGLRYLTPLRFWMG